MLDKYVLVSGTFAGGDAAGVFILSSPAGYDDGNLEIFTKDETLNGSTSGAGMAVATNTGAVQITGRLIPDTDLVEYEGKKYCQPHYKFKFEITGRTKPR